MGVAHSDCGVEQVDLEQVAGVVKIERLDELWSRVELCEVTVPRKGAHEALDKVFCLSIYAHVQRLRALNISIDPSIFC